MKALTPKAESMKRNSSGRNRPILVFPHEARIEIPEALYSSSASISIHASAHIRDKDSVRATGKRRGEAAEAAFLLQASSYSIEQVTSRTRHSVFRNMARAGAVK